MPKTASASVVPCTCAMPQSSRVIVTALASRCQRDASAGCGCAPANVLTVTVRSATVVRSDWRIDSANMGMRRGIGISSRDKGAIVEANLTTHDVAQRPGWDDGRDATLHWLNWRMRECNVGLVIGFADVPLQWAFHGSREGVIHEYEPARPLRPL